jgi:type IV secretory pathway VirB2 component (pilin)
MFSNGSRQMECMSMGFAVGIHIVTDLLKAFLGSGLVNTFQSATVEDVSQ